MLAPDGSLDRARLRRRVMGDPDALAALNAIVHPEVSLRRDVLVRAAERRGERIVVTDIPLLFEVADPAAFDAVILVDAPIDVRRNRLLGTRGLSPDEADRMMASQLPSAEKRARSDYVIDNSGDLGELERAARTVWDSLQRRVTATEGT
jgi:dephospho-CoA kinase